jgi:hypothetical protein
MRYLFVLLMLVIIAQQATATMAYFEKAPLPKADIAQLETLICLEPHKLKAEHI